MQGMRGLSTVQCCGVALHPIASPTRHSSPALPTPTIGNSAWSVTWPLSKRVWLWMVLAQWPSCLHSNALESGVSPRLSSSVSSLQCLLFHKLQPICVGIQRQKMNTDCASYCTACASAAVLGLALLPNVVMPSRKGMGGPEALAEALPQIWAVRCVWTCVSSPAIRCADNVVPPVPAGNAVSPLSNHAMLERDEAVFKLPSTLDLTETKVPSLPPDISADPLARACCNAILQTYLHISASSSKSLLLLIAMTECKLQHVTADVVSYNLVIAASCKNGEVSKAKGVYDALLQAQLQPNTATFLPMLVAAEEAGDDQGVFDLWEALKRAHVRPDVTCCTSYIITAVRRGGISEIREAASWMHAMIGAHGVAPPSIVMTDALLVALSKSGLLTEVICLTNAAARAGLALSSSTLATCFRHTAGCSSWRRAWDLFQTALLAGYANVDLLQACAEVLHDVASTDVLPMTDRVEAQRLNRQVHVLANPGGCKH